MTDRPNPSLNPGQNPEHQILNPVYTPSWPHTPPTDTFLKAHQAHQDLYEQPDKPNPNPTPREHFQLAEIFDDLIHAHDFRVQAISDLHGLRTINPLAPVRGHIIAVALTGSSPSTIGCAVTILPTEDIILPRDFPNNFPDTIQFNPDNPASPANQSNPDQLIAVTVFSQLLRDTRWLGLDPILPFFQGKLAVIIGNPASGQPRAAVGLPPHMFDDSPHPPPTPDHPETQALANVLTWHGATVHWVPLPD